MAIAPAFIRKVYRLLDETDPMIVRWEHDGLSFLIVDTEAFEKFVLPLYFRGRLNTFRNQLMYHGFIEVESLFESYFHPNFRRGAPELLVMIVPTGPRPRRASRRKERARSTTRVAKTKQVEGVDDDFQQLLQLLAKDTCEDRQKPLDRVYEESLDMVHWELDIPDALRLDVFEYFSPSASLLSGIEKDVRRASVSDENNGWPAIWDEHDMNELQEALVECNQAAGAA